MKKWAVTIQVNLDASHWETIYVKANSERKARIYAEKKASQKYFIYTIISVKEVTK